MRFLFLLLIGLSIAACGTSESDSGDTASSESTPSTSTPGKLTLTPFTESQQYSDATLEFVSFEDGNWNFKVGGSTYELGAQTSDVASKGCANSSKGQHIHLIVDDQPYAAKYETSFKRDIADGKVSVLAFLSRSYHESIKTDKAYTAQMIKMTDGVVNEIEPITYPMIFYSRPKGVYEGEDTKRVMLDYYLINTKPGQYVQADINGQIFDLKDWQPYYIEGLPAGDNTIKLSLLNEDGKLVRVQNNPVARNFKLNPAPK
jgi:hypothetical protein